MGTCLNINQKSMCTTSAQPTHLPCKLLILLCTPFSHTLCTPSHTLCKSLILLIGRCVHTLPKIPPYRGIINIPLHRVGCGFINPPYRWDKLEKCDE